MDLRFDETRDALAVRIEAHKLYSTLKLEDVLEEALARLAPGAALDGGCGSGNFSALIARRASCYVGFDKSPELLAAAAAAAREAGARNAVFLRQDLDEPLRLASGQFDFVLFAYSAYYTSDVGALLDEVRRVCRPEASVCLIGPVAGNGRELDEVTSRLFGRAASAAKGVRAERLEAEFLPELRKRFRTVEAAVKDFSVRFPGPAEFERYYRATPQYLEMANAHGRPGDDAVRAAVAAQAPATVSKKSVFLWARGA